MKLKEFLNEKEMETALEIYGEEGLKLRKLGIDKYKKLDEGSYEAWGDFKGNPKDIPFKIKIFHGDFNCSNNELKTLKGCPEIIDGTFYCSHNDLTSLEGGPKIVKNGYLCNYNILKTLKGSPKNINGVFDCSNNNLESLEGGPKKTSTFRCYLNELKTLKGCPEIIDGHFNCSENELKSLKYGPKKVNGDYLCNYNDKQFENEYISSICKVKGKIIV